LLAVIFFCPVNPPNNPSPPPIEDILDYIVIRKNVNYFLLKEIV